MFTGIITDIGTVDAIEKAGDTRFRIRTSYETGTIDLGASIACSGPCLTVVDKGPGNFSVDVSAETLSKTTLEAWRVGHRVNLERALKMGDELGGHLVSGHVDGTVRVLDIRPEGDSLRYVFGVSEDLRKFVSPKGSVALDGVSLTVNEVENGNFGVNIIPHTQSETTLGALKIGDRVNFEIDMLARYIARLMES